MNRRRQPPRGYVLMVVIVLGIVLASLSGILLFSTGRDRAEGKQQAASVRAVYASEAAVAVGIETLRAVLEQKTSPTAADLAVIENQTRAAAVSAMIGTTFPVISVRYYDPIKNIVQDTPTSNGNELVTITSGPNKGLRAQQTPIQVLATARVNNASASVADAIRVDLIPVFQFAIFFDGDLEFQRPARMSVSGRVHTNSDLYLSNGEQVDFFSTVTVAGLVNSRSSFASSVAVGTGTSATLFTKLPGTTLAAIANDLPRSTANQKTYLQATYGVEGGLQDSTTGVEPLSIPLRLSSSDSCVTNATCGVGRSCVKVRVSDPAGVCTFNVTSRPDKCGDGTTTAEFSQSLAVELIKRPATDYANNSASAPYKVSFNRDTDLLNPQTSPYQADFGPRPNISVAALNEAAPAQIEVQRRVPRLTSTTADDDPGAVVDRMYWKAHIRIVDGIWYRQGTTTPVFDPEQHAPGTASPVATDMIHAFARVLRYSWWWDARENRVYCEAVANTNDHCVTDGNEYHRGAQIRATDFDMAAFMALLERADARAALFPGGLIPDGGVIIYMSETYDPKFEDANSRLPRAANVRNLLNFPITTNAYVAADMITTPVGVFASLAPAFVRKAAVTTITNATTPTPLAPFDIGWFPENIWGRLAPAGFESMIRPTGVNSTFYGLANPMTGKNGSLCAIPGTDYTSSRRPTSRPASMSTPGILPPCIQVGAQPLGPENAVRIIRGQTMPIQGLTFVTDNRLYLHGDMNVRKDSTTKSGGFDTSQDIGGKISFMADSITIQSERFSDREHQSSNGDTKPNIYGFFREPGLVRVAATTYGPTSWAGTAAIPRLPYSGPSVGNGIPANVCSVVANVAAFETRINSSLLMGDVPSCIGGGTNVGSPSGGVNNFPRFVEVWSGIDLVINGSMVGLFRSERGNARFLNAQTDSTGTVRTSRLGSPYTDANKDLCDYRPPARKWTFDDILLQGIDKLPPGTPRVVANDRLRWVRR